VNVAEKQTIFNLKYYFFQINDPYDLLDL